MNLKRFYPVIGNTNLLKEYIYVLILSFLVALGVVTLSPKTSILLFLFSLASVVIIRYWRWFPLFLLLYIWYVPGQTPSGGLLENYMALKWSTYVIIPIIFAGYFIPGFLRNKWDMTPIIVPLFLIALCILLSAFVNGTNLLNLTSSFGLYLRYPLIFLVFANMRLEEKVIKKVIQIFILLTLMQIPEILFRNLVLGISGDYISWSLGPWGHFPLGIYCIYSICIVSAMSLITGFRWYHLLLLTAFITPAGIGEIKMLIVCAPVVLFVVILGARRLDVFIRRGLPLLFLLAVAVYWTYINWESLAGSDFLSNFLLNIKYFFTLDLKNTDPLSINRIGQIFLMWDVISNSYKNLIFGFGPGSSLAGNLLGTAGIVALRLTGPSGQLVAVLGDLGLVGLLLHLGLFLIILKFTFRCLKEVRKKSYKVVSIAFLGIWVFYVILGPLYNLVWRYDVSSFMFWFIAAVIYRKTRVIKKLEPA